MDDRYSLKWHPHRDVVMESLLQNFLRNSLTDCILMVGERQIRAHKVILSSCSSYFQDILELTSDKVPVFIFTNISFEELSYIIEYMYTGEVIVDQHTISRLLTIGRDLKIKGLCPIDLPSFDQPPTDKPLNSSLENQKQFAYGSSPLRLNNFGKQTGQKKQENRTRSKATTKSFQQTYDATKNLKTSSDRIPFGVNGYEEDLTPEVEPQGPINNVTPQDLTQKEKRQGSPTMEYEPTVNFSK